ncbi:hypothetical protein RR46_05115 [Papilio xuthus]|uniref:Uncharacterized protein n=1 Tax=Papilio xuthus TaxID=66420 RepID=A0A194QEL3_PAPXU|nr:hypothetical protein RR46_05115 [Papilio xuthus]
MLKALKDAKKSQTGEETSEGSTNNIQEERNDNEEPPPKASSVVVKNPVNVSTQTPDISPSKEDVRK